MLDIRQVKFSIVRTPTERMLRMDEVGDYFENQVIAYDTGIGLYNQMILLHELVEYFLITLKGLRWQDIDLFDRIKKRKELLSKFPRAKYYLKANKVALNLEKQIIEFLEQDWKEYDGFIRSIRIS